MNEQDDVTIDELMDIFKHDRFRGIKYPSLILYFGTYTMLSVSGEKGSWRVYLYAETEGIEEWYGASTCSGVLREVWHDKLQDLATYREGAQFYEQLLKLEQWEQFPVSERKIRAQCVDAVQHVFRKYAERLDYQRAQTDDTDVFDYEANCFEWSILESCTCKMDGVPVRMTFHHTLAGTPAHWSASVGDHSSSGLELHAAEETIDFILEDAYKKYQNALAERRSFSYP